MILEVRSEVVLSAVGIELQS
jgi:hypothetical protein